MRLQELDKANNHLVDNIKARQEKEKKKKEEDEKANEDPDDAMAVDQETQPDAKDKQSSEKKSKKRDKERKEEPSQGDPATVTGARLFEITQCFGALLEVRTSDERETSMQAALLIPGNAIIRCRQVENACEMRSKSTWPPDSCSMQRKLPMLLLLLLLLLLGSKAKISQTEALATANRTASLSL